MVRLSGRLASLILIVALMWLEAGCVAPQATATPTPPPLITSTRPPTLTPAATLTPLVIVVAPSASPVTPTARPTVATATPIVLPSATGPALSTPSSTPAPGGLPTAAPPASSTAPPAATTALPSIQAFTAAPAEIMPGQPVTLTWQAAGQQLTIYRLDALGRLSEFYNVEPAGSLVLSPPAGQRTQVAFVLYATSGSTTISASASVRIQCPDTWFFANPPAECPASPPHNTLMAAEHFERGLMLWTAFDDRIYVLYADGGTPKWDVLQNTWFAGLADSDPALTAPAGLYQPVRGFGLAWRAGYVSPSQQVRDRLGWATEPEYSLSGAQQCDSAPKYNRCYLTGPGGAVYVLQPERSGWNVWTGP